MRTGLDLEGKGVESSTTSIPAQDSELIKDCLVNIDKCSTTFTDALNADWVSFQLSDQIIKEIQSITEYVKEIENIMDKFDKESFVSWLKPLYDFLDSLTLFQESAVFHIMLFIVLILTVLNILFIFFGNEVINFFKIETKYPSFSGLIKLRAKFQRYYLMWDIFILFLVCLCGIGANLIVLIMGHK